MIDFWEVANEACSVYKAQQRSAEFAQVLELVSNLNPQIMLEIGCADGGTLFAWTQICTEVYGITFDNELGTVDANGLHVYFDKRTFGAMVYYGDSHDQSALDWITEQLDGRELDLLHIDGDHTYRGVSLDWDMYSPLVRQDGLVLIHDVGHAKKWFPGLWQWWEELDRGYIIQDERIDKRSGFGIVMVGED